MPGGSISYALLAGLAMALLIAAVTDLRRRQIDNWLNLAIALSAPLYWLASGLGSKAVLFQLALAFATLLLSGVLFVLRQMGGGDVKLLTALALWFVPGSFGQLVAIMGMVGGGASIGLAVFNMRREPGQAWRDVLAVVAATLWVMFACAFTYALATGEPPITPIAFARVAAVLPRGWTLAALGLGVVAVAIYGFAQIFRRQEGRVSIPYGVAISGAGLWVLAGIVVGV